jgi:uncharacterized repeat protein (TIGR02543 family)
MKTWKQMSFSPQTFIGILIITALAMIMVFTMTSCNDGTETAYYTVTYDFNGGIGNNNRNQVSYPNQKSGDIIRVYDRSNIAIHVLSFHRTNYDFTGWNTKADGGGISYSPGDWFVINSNITLYAQWDYIPPPTSWRDLPLADVMDYGVVFFPTGGNQGHMTTAMNNSTLGLLISISTMRSNIQLFRNASVEWDLTGLPNQAFMTDIITFQEAVFFNGMGEVDKFLAEITTNHVTVENRELFTAYVNAYRGMSYIGVRNRDTQDYESTVNWGNGAASVTDLLQTVNSIKGEETYFANGEHQKTAMRNGAVSLLEDTAEGRLVADVIIIFGNFSQYIGLADYISQERKLNIMPSPETIGSLSTTLGGTVQSWQLASGIFNIMQMLTRANPD